MSNPESNDLNQLKQALSALKKARVRLDSIEKSQKEPIAIIGMGCRFPGGANSPEAFWSLLEKGVDAISEVPADRWNVDVLYDSDPSVPGKMSSRWGGFIDPIDQFDPNFFGISPREAAQMDPQQRLVLEVAWEAIEDAGLTKTGLAGSQTGVYVGVHSHSTDYTMYQYADPNAIDIYTGTGTAHNVIGGRLSYLFDLRGPTITVDTACSSSLVAVHLACQSLRVGESRMSIVAGVNLILSPEFSIAASKMHMLAPDGRCKAFDSQANGFVRGEGCGVIILKRLSDALADGDRILALIRGSAINQDGHTNGLTAPNGLSQQDVIHRALENGGVAPTEIGYIEAHGTGTSLGDVIELESLSAIFSQDDHGNFPCFLGSAKANIGHLEGAAGIAGLIKTVLSFQKKSIPPLVHFKTLNPNVSLDGTRLSVSAGLQPWQGNRKHLAGVSSFGWSGTNAHVILEEAPGVPEKVASSENDRVFLLPISAQSRRSLDRLVESYREFLVTEKNGSLPDLGDICYTASLRRSPHEHRLVVVGRTHQELAEKLGGFMQDKTLPGASSNYVTAEAAPRVAFVFPGQGSQWIGMGQELMAREPVFRDALLKCEQAIRLYADWSLTEQLQNGSNARLDEIDVIQPTLFAIQVALAALWRSWGITPDAVVGHSMGEVAAAHIAGALDLQNAARIICTRSRLLRRVSGRGVMAVVGLSLDEAQQVVKNYSAQLSVAVNNSPRSTVLSGDPAAMDRLFEELGAKNIFYRPVKVDVASHSPQMDPLLPELLKELDGLQSKPADIPFYSTVEGRRSGDLSFDKSYWADNLRQPVLFSKTIEKLAQDGHTIFIEISPHAILLPAIEETLHHLKKNGSTLPSLLREEAEQSTILGSLGRLYTLGYPIDWTKHYPGGGRLASLPKYQWDHQRYWVESVANRATASKREGGQVLGIQENPLLGVRLPPLAHLPKSTVWQMQIDNAFRAYLKENKIDDVTTAMVFEGANAVFGPKTHLIRESHTYAPLALDASSDATLQLILTRGESMSASFELYQRQANTDTWSKLIDGEIEIGQVDADWMYKLEWQSKPLRVSATVAKSNSRWLIFGDRAGFGKEITAGMEALGCTCTLASYEPGNPEGITRAINQGLKAGQLDGILYLWGLDAPSNEELDADLLVQSQTVTAAGLLQLVQSLLSVEQVASPRAWVVTRGVQPVAQTDSVQVAQSLLWGLGRGIAIEHPDLWGGIIDLENNEKPRSEDVNRVLAEIFAADQERQVAYRSGERYAPRLVRWDTEKPKYNDLQIRSDASYLITGGLGRLGLEVARWLVEQGAKHLTLTSRTGLPPEEEWSRVPSETLMGKRIEAIRALKAMGATISVLRVDASQSLEMTRLFETLASNHHTLSGVFHIAGVEDYSPVQEITVERFNEILRPKVSGAWLLHGLSQSLSAPLDFFIMFSSAASIWGSKGLAHYAAANHFLDILAHHRRAHGLPALSINWGWWEEGGMGQGQLAELFSSVGLRKMLSNDGLAAMKYLLETDIVEAVVASVDWNEFKPVYAVRQAQPVLEWIEGTEPSKMLKDRVAAQKNTILQQLKNLSPSKQRDTLLDLVREEVANMLGLDQAETLDIQQGFFRLGMDSITSIRLRNNLQSKLDLQLPPTLAFEHPTVAALTDFLVHEIFSDPAAPMMESAKDASGGVVDQQSQAKLKDLSKDELFALLDDELSGIDKLTEGK
ncbi:MAG: type I polyketide synthase [Anaerolineales bacterium]|nr:MAG: type I polyketide synthase [Anaerolineales bacterium]